MFTFLKFPPAISLIQFGNRAANAIQAATEAGTGFVFGYLGGGPLPFSAINPGASFVLAFNALPIVLVVSATQIERQTRLMADLRAMQLPMVIVITMADEAKKLGITDRGTYGYAARVPDCLTAARAAFSSKP